MKKIILIIGLLLSSYVFAQQRPRVEAVRYIEVTTAERDLFSVPSGEHWKIYNITTGQFEYWDGDSWEVLGFENGHTIQENGVSQTDRDNLNFKTGFIVSDNAGNNSTDVDLSFSIDDTAYGAGWNGNTTDGASKNAIFDKIESVIAGSGATATKETKADFNGTTDDTWVVTVTPSTGHMLFEGSALLVEGVHYTKSGNTITYTSPPTAGITHSYFPNVVVNGDGTFTGLTDTPSSFSGQGDKWIKVNTGANALEFVDAPSGGAVDSVNSQTGVVVLDADDIDDTSTTHKFTTAADISKLAGIEANATADQTGAEIKAAYESEADTNAFTDADHSKLDGIEAGADVTDETNVVTALNGATLTDVGTPAATDRILLQDASDSNNLKYADFSEFGGGGGATIITQDEGSQIDAAATTLNFVGTGVTATDAGSNVTTVTINSGGVDMQADFLLNAGGGSSANEIGTGWTFSSNPYSVYLDGVNGLGSLNWNLNGTLYSLNLGANYITPSGNGDVDLGQSGSRFDKIWADEVEVTNGYKTTGGTSSGFLKANGTVDTSTYLTAPSFSQYAISFNQQTSHANGTVNFSSGGALTYTVQPNSSVNVPVGTRIMINNENATTVTITAGSGVTLNGGTAALSTGQAAWIVQATIDEWLIININ